MKPLDPICLATALTILLTACTPSPPPSSQPAAEPPAASCESETQTAAEAARCAADGAAANGAATANAAALSATPATGRWSFHGDSGVTSTCFGAPNSECAISFMCEAPSGKVSVLYSAELIPDQPTTLTAITRTQTLAIPARSFNEGLPSINAELADTSTEKAALLEALTPTQDVFAIDANGEITVYPWDESVAQTLNACR